MTPSCEARAPLPVKLTRLRNICWLFESPSPGLMKVFTSLKTMTSAPPLGIGLIFTWAQPLFGGLACTAHTSNVAGDGTVAGAVYPPAVASSPTPFDIVPKVELPPGMPLTVHEYGPTPP